jgi:site-specific DNA-methyltransferase (adenine-specific)
VIELNKIYNMDCLEGMKLIDDKSIDMILCDLPYGATACKWDTIIPFEPLWEQYERIIKDNGAIVLTAQQPFASSLINSNPKLFKYEWIWVKSKPTGHMNAKRMPMRKHESILVFSKKSPTYHPQGLKKTNKLIKRTNHGNYGESAGKASVQKFTGYPNTILNFNNVMKKQLHPTQKPVELFEYLIKTYTNEGETVLDNCMGSGTTAVACINTNRNFIGFELDPDYYKIAEERIRKAKLDKLLEVQENA